MPGYHLIHGWATDDGRNLALVSQGTQVLFIEIGEDSFRTLAVVADADAPKRRSRAQGSGQA